MSINFQDKQLKIKISPEFDGDNRHCFVNGYTAPSFSYFSRDLAKAQVVNCSSNDRYITRGLLQNVIFNSAYKTEGFTIVHEPSGDNLITVKDAGTAEKIIKALIIYQGLFPVRISDAGWVRSLTQKKHGSFLQLGGSLLFEIVRTYLGICKESDLFKSLFLLQLEHGNDTVAIIQKFLNG